MRLLVGVEEEEMSMMWRRIRGGGILKRVRGSEVRFVSSSRFFLLVLFFPFISLTFFSLRSSLPAKKKAKAINLTRTVSDLNGRVQELEVEAGELRSENK